MIYHYQYKYHHLLVSIFSVNLGNPSLCVLIGSLKLLSNYKLIEKPSFENLINALRDIIHNIHVYT